jgi:hypothetical protein
LDRVGDRFGHRLEWSGVGDALVWAVRVVEDLILAHCMQEMALVPDQCSVEELAAAAAYPPFHDRVHARHPDAAAHDGDPAVGEDRVEQRRVLPVAVADEVAGRRTGVL